MKDIKITVFRDLYKATDVPYIVPLSKIVDRIREGKKKSIISKMRATKDKEEYTRLKYTLPAIVFQGVFPQRNDDSCTEPSGLMIHDYDKFPDEKELKKTLHFIVSNPHTVLAFISPGGKGIKVLVKIPICGKKEYKKYFAQYHKEFDYPFFDPSNSNLSRVCFESWDPDIYVNYNAKVYSPELIEEGYKFTEKTPVIPLSNEDKIVDMIMKWNWKTDFIEGERNQYIFNLAGAFCEYGVSKDYTIGYIDNNIREGDFTESEMKTAINSAYRSRSFGSKYFEDYEKKNKIQAELGNSKKEVISKYNISEEIYDQLRSEYEHDDFWFYEEDSKGKQKLKIDPLKYKYYLERNGFKKHFPHDSQKPTWVFIESNKVIETSTDKIKDFVLSQLLKRKELAVWTYCAKYQNLFSEGFLSMLETVELNMLKDEKEKSFIAYQNGILEITKDDKTLVDYIDVDGYIWKNRILERDYVNSDEIENDYQKFISNISNAEPLPMECTLGYLLHGYKNKMNNKAVILNDEIISDNPEGGTGKGLLIQGLRQIRKVSILDGKSFDDKKSFPYQTVSPETEILVFDDVKKNFDFESKFSLVTEGMTLERKNKDAIKLSVEDSPKLVISTNYAIKGEGNSHDRRRHEVEVAQYYSKDITPFLEFERQLFDDWKESDFTAFDNYMAGCIQLYLKQGLVHQNAKNLKKRKLIAETSMEFLEFISDTENVPLNIRHDKSEFFQVFINEYKDYQKWLSRKRFNIWIQKYASFADLEFLQGKSMNLKWFVIRRKGETEIETNDEVPF